MSLPWNSAYHDRIVVQVSRVVPIIDLVEKVEMIDKLIFRANGPAEEIVNVRHFDLWRIQTHAGRAERIEVGIKLRIGE